MWYWAMKKMPINDFFAKNGQIRDDGRGFDATTAGAGRSGWGMVTMRERALASGGTLTVESAPGRGTRIEVTVAVA